MTTTYSLPSSDYYTRVTSYTAPGGATWRRNYHEVALEWAISCERNSWFLKILLSCAEIRAALAPTSYAPCGCSLTQTRRCRRRPRIDSRGTRFSLSFSFLHWFRPVSSSFSRSRVCVCDSWTIEQKVDSPRLCSLTFAASFIIPSSSCERGERDPCVYVCTLGVYNVTAKCLQTKCLLVYFGSFYRD